MKLILRGFLCLLLVLVLILPALALPTSTAQGPGLPETSVVVTFDTYDREAGNFMLQTVTGRVTYHQQAGGVLTMEGTGSGTLTWDQSNLYCPDTGELSFPATINGTVIPMTTGSETQALQLGIQAYVGKKIGDEAQYVKEYSVDCFDPINNEHWKEDKRIGPVPLLPLVQVKKNMTSWEGQEGFESDTVGSIIKVKLSPPNLTEVIEVQVDKPILNPTDASPKAKVTVTAKGADGNGIKQMAIKIEACTEKGSKDTDGHIHDTRSDKCDAGRPKPIFKYNGIDYRGTLTAVTNDAGQIVFDYEPPFSLRVFKDANTGLVTSTSTTQKLYISGKDNIIATKVQDSTIKDDAWITTKVDGLYPMPGGAGCSNAIPSYYFSMQGKHECIFYATPATNEAIARIAQRFMDFQTACKEHPELGPCSTKDLQGNDVSFTITGDNKKVRITAMSLPWGGICDIAGDWKNPHVTHRDGKSIDIGLADFRTGNKLDTDRIKLLWTVISLDPNFKSFEPGEGLPYSATVSHFHANFKS
jgi:hypothetical protein